MEACILWKVFFEKLFTTLPELRGVYSDPGLFFKDLLVKPEIIGLLGNWLMKPSRFSTLFPARLAPRLGPGVLRVAARLVLLYFPGVFRKNGGIQTQARITRWTESTHRAPQADPFASPTPRDRTSPPPVPLQQPLAPPLRPQTAPPKGDIYGVQQPLYPAVVQPYFYPQPPPAAAPTHTRSSSYQQPPVARRQGSYPPPPPPPGFMYAQPGPGPQSVYAPQPPPVYAPGPVYAQPQPMYQPQPVRSPTREVPLLRRVFGFAGGGGGGSGKLGREILLPRTRPRPPCPPPIAVPAPRNRARTTHPANRIRIIADPPMFSALAHRDRHGAQLFRSTHHHIVSSYLSPPLHTSLTTASTPSPPSSYIPHTPL
ncbi:hypothetical protein DFH09DRAFT_1369568 [Mycena vulgaris]|nr:hypothetical protein DFH09DRAFT_1369568 [Mycena vulgaris]